MLETEEERPSEFKALKNLINSENQPSKFPPLTKLIRGNSDNDPNLNCEEREKLEAILREKMFIYLENIINEDYGTAPNSFLENIREAQKDALLTFDQASKLVLLINSFKQLN